MIASQMRGFLLPEYNWRVTMNDKKPDEITLRDYFAAKAMSAIIRRYDGISFGGNKDSHDYKELSEDAYFIADAMIKVRENDNA